ncbi:MAG: ABC transporter ATP-binding protein [Turicibacter sp.]|nr:ABC transporter ATP-binding protein [Turicibacter sp.]
MVISIQNVCKQYVSGDIKTTALKDVNLEVKKGEFVVILGPSGSGKSTLLHVSGGLDQVNDGTILVSGQEITKMKSSQLTDFRRKELGFIFQQYNLMPNMTVFENVEVGARLSDNPLDVNNVLKEVMLDDLFHQFPYQLSGGQQQRVAIARAIAKNPSILFCDEPTGALDEDTGKTVLEILQRINEEFQTTIFLITHNLGIAEIADKVVRMKSGEIVEVKQNSHKKRACEVSWA